MINESMKKWGKTVTEKQYEIAVGIRCGKCKNKECKCRLSKP